MKLEHRFWDWVKDEATGERTLYLEGPIDEELFWGDEVTPKAFKKELESGDGDIVVYITSPGGNVFAASDIYTMLLEYKGKVTVKISSIAASAASVIAMAGDVVKMSPTAQLMIHNPSTVVWGNVKAMEEAIVVLNKIKDSIVNAYHLKSGLSRAKISSLLDGPSGEGTWLPADEALKYGFIDEIISRNADKKEEPGEDDPEEDEPEEGEDPGQGAPVVEPDSDPDEDDPDKDDPDGDDPEEDEPDEDEPKKAKSMAGDGPRNGMYTRASDFIHREYLAMTDSAKENPEGQEAPQKFATYDAMLKQLEMLKNW